MSRAHHISKRCHNAFAARQAQASGTIRGEAGQDLNSRKLAQLRALGEPGQYVVGRLAGLTVAEIAVRREWTPDEAADYERQGLAWLAREGAA